MKFNEPIDPSVIIPLSLYQELKLLINSKIENTWISTKLKLPPERESVLLLTVSRWECDGEKRCSVHYYVGKLICLKNGKKYFSSKFKLNVEDVEYWMPIPRSLIEEY